MPGNAAVTVTVPFHAAARSGGAERATEGQPVETRSFGSIVLSMFWLGQPVMKRFLSIESDCAFIRRRESGDGVAARQNWGLPLCKVGRVTLCAPRAGTS